MAAVPCVRLLGRGGLVIRQQWRSIFLSRHTKEEYDIESEETFKEKVLESTKPVIVDFHAVWCSPCKQLGPILSNVVNKRENKVDLAKVDIDKHPELAIQYGVAAVPTVMLFQDGKMLKSFLGVLPEADIEQFVPIQ